MAQTAAPPEPAATLTVYAREVVLDVVALDAKGHSVTGLTAHDFRLLEDGESQVVKGVSEHHAMTAEQVAAIAPAKLPANTFSNFVPQGNTNSVNVILIDALDSPVVAQMYLRQQLIVFMKTVPPGNVFAIFELDNSMHLVQGFTSDPEVLLKAVESKRESVVLPPLLAKGNGLLREHILNAGLQVMGRYLAGFPGRKNLIWFTGAVPHTIFGLKRNPFPDSVDYDNRTSKAANALSLSRIAMYPVDDRGLEVYDWSHFSHPELERVADTTGGKAFFNTNGMKEALTQIVATGSNYYTLAYSPTNPVWRAHHREVVLSVPGRRGVTLLYRHIYYARSERSAQRKADVKAAAHAFTPDAPSATVEGQVPATAETSKEDFGAAMTLGTVPSGEVQFDVTLNPAATAVKLKKDEPLPEGNFLREDFQRKPFRNFEVLFRVDPGRIDFALLSDGKHRAELELVAIVFDAEGQQLNSFTITRDFTLEDAIYQDMSSHHVELKARTVIAIPEKGNYFLRFGVRDTATELIGSLEVPVDNIQLMAAGTQTAP